MGLASAFRFVALNISELIRRAEFYMKGSVIKMKIGYLVKRFVPYFKKYKWILIFDLLCASLTTVCELVFPMFVRYITDMGINDIGLSDGWNYSENRFVLLNFTYYRFCG